MPTKGGGYSAGKVLLEIQGKAAGFLYSVDGGEAFADAVNEDPPVDGVILKHPGPVRYAPIVMTCGTGMTTSFYDWIAQVVKGTQAPRDGALVFLDYTFTEVLRLEFTQALATEVAFPAGDGASKEPAYLTLTIQPQVTHRHKGHAGTKHAGVFGKAQKKWLAANFRFDIGQLATKKVLRVEPIVVTQPLGPGPALSGPVDVSAVVFSVPESDADPVYAWHEDFVVQGNNGPEQERSGVLRFLDPNYKDVLFRIDLGHLGVLRVAPERHEANAQVISRSHVEMYCEQVRFSAEPLSAGAQLADAGAGAAGGVARAPAMAAAGPPTGSPGEVPPTPGEAVIGRLLAAEAATGMEPSDEPRRARGRALGRAWASQRAGLDDLTQVAGMDGKAWSAVALPEGHSLIPSLHELGLLPIAEHGPIDLDRDPFVEGLVAGVAAVYEEVGPGLARLSAQSDEMSSLRLQTALDRMNKLLEMLSNIMKKMSDTQQCILQNLK
jgi:hypothetical protein